MTPGLPGDQDPRPGGGRPHWATGATRRRGTCARAVQRADRPGRHQPRQPVLLAARARRRGHGRRERHAGNARQLRRGRRHGSGSSCTTSRPAGSTASSWCRPAATTGTCDPAHLAGMPVVLAASPPVRIDVDAVLLDDFGGTWEATRQLIDAAAPQDRLPRPAGVDLDRLRALPRVLRRAGGGGPPPRRADRLPRQPRTSPPPSGTLGSCWTSRGPADGRVHRQQPQHHRCLPRDPARRLGTSHSPDSTTSSSPTCSPCR